MKVIINDEKIKFIKDLLEDSRFKNFLKKMNSIPFGNKITDF